MMKRYLILCFIVFTVVNLSYADQWMIDDFESVNSDLSPNWTIQWFPMGTQLRTSRAYDGQYAAFLPAPSVSGTKVTTSNPVGLQFGDSICNYNISFWYNLTGKIATEQSFLYYIYMAIGYDWDEAEENEDYYELYISNNQTFINDSQWHKMTFPIHYFEYINCMDTLIDWVAITHDNFNIPSNIDFTIDNLMVENYTPPPPEECVETWQCSDWGTCVSGIQTRTCTDLNVCNTTLEKPSETRQCISVTLTSSVSVENRIVTVDATAASENGINWVKTEITLPNNTVITKTLDRITGTSLSGTYRTTYETPACGNHHVKISAYDEVNTETSTRYVDVSQILVATLEIEDSYNKTDTIQAGGTISDISDVYLRIGNQEFTENQTEDFLFDYTILQTDLSGIWNVTLIATGICNTTTVHRTIEVTDPDVLETYNVVFTSPDAGSPYTRGETVDIKVRVEQGGVVVQGADVFAYIENDRISIIETTPGNYHLEYKIPYDLKTGTVPIYVRAEKDDKGGTSSVDILVQRATLNVAVSYPERIIIDTPAEIQVNVTYPDGTPASGLDLDMSIPGGTLDFTEVTPGVYEATYTPTSLAVWNMRISTRDDYQNLASETATIQVTEPETVDILYDFLSKYWYFILIAVILVGIISYPLAKKRGRKVKHQELLKEKKRIENLQKDLQRAYFQKGEVEKATFEKKSEEYEVKLRNIKEELMREKKKIRQKKEKKPEVYKKEEEPKKKEKPAKKKKSKPKKEKRKETKSEEKGLHDIEL